MLIMWLYIILTLFISMIMILLNFLISKKMLKFREKMSPFECGFDIQSNLRNPFSLQFYLITIIFLIFDVEISLIFPFIISMNNYYFTMMINFIFLMMLLLIGFYIELKEGAFNWFKLLNNLFMKY